MKTVLAGVFVLFSIHGCGCDSDGSDSDTTTTAPGYAVVVDCGSSKTRGYVYSIAGASSDGDVPTITYVNKTGKEGALADPSTDITEAMNSILKSVSDMGIADMNMSRTPIYAYGTAGLRGLDVTQQDDIWTKVRGVLSGSGYLFKKPVLQARTLSGTQEGLFGWLSLNYLSGAFNSSAEIDPSGDIDFGGKSVQVAFSTDNLLMNDAVVQSVGSDIYTVYDVSYMNTGNDAAMYRSIYTLLLQTYYDDLNQGKTADLTQVEFSCFNKGSTMDISSADLQSVASSVPGSEKITLPATVTVTGKGDYTECKAQVLKLLHPEYVPCLQYPCAANGRYQPKIDMDMNAFGTPWFGLNGMGVGKNSPSKTAYTWSPEWDDKTLTDFAKKYCASPAPSDDKYSWQYCWEVALSTAFFQVLNLKSVSVSEDVNGVDFSWSIGAVLFSYEEYRFADLN